MKDMDKYLERLEDEWARVQHKRKKHKKEKVRKKMKERMDLILKVNLKLQTCKQSLEAIHMVHGNSNERPRMKEEMEARLLDLDKLGLFQSILNQFYFRGSPSRVEPHHISRKSMINTELNASRIVPDNDF